MNKEVPVPISESRLKKFYGPGGFSENLAVNSVAQLVNPVFAIALGVSPALVGLAMALPRLVDAFTDPIMGSISDNWQGKWGRKRIGHQGLKGTWAGAKGKTCI